MPVRWTTSFYIFLQLCFLSTYCMFGAERGHVKNKHVKHSTYYGYIYSLLLNNWTHDDDIDELWTFSNHRYKWMTESIYITIIVISMYDFPEFIVCESSELAPDFPTQILVVKTHTFSDFVRKALKHERRPNRITNNYLHCNSHFPYKLNKKKKTQR